MSKKFLHKFVARERGVSRVDVRRQSGAISRLKYELSSQRLCPQMALQRALPIKRPGEHSFEQTMLVARTKSLCKNEQRKKKRAAAQ